jgi:hypothetical protein
LKGDFADSVGRSAKVSLNSIARIIEALRRYRDSFRGRGAENRTGSYGRARGDLPGGWRKRRDCGAERRRRKKSGLIHLCPQNPNPPVRWLESFG